VRQGRDGPLQPACTVARALRRSLGLLGAAAVLSGVINVLALTGPLYMLSLYDGVLPSQSLLMLAVLTLAMLGLYSLSGLLDCLRLRVMGRLANRVDRNLSARVFSLQVSLPLNLRSSGEGLQPTHDLDQIHRFLSGPGPAAIFDLPWTPLYLGAIFLMHPLLGLFAASSALGLAGLMLLAEIKSPGPAAAARINARRTALAAAARRSAEVVHAMGMEPHLARHWLRLNARHRGHQRRAGRIADAAGAAIRAARPALQSGMLGLGALLVLREESSPGTMIAAAIVLARALAPVEAAITHWRSFASAREARTRLNALLAAQAVGNERAENLSTRCRELSVDNVCVVPPGARHPVLSDVSFTLEAGAGLGIIGPSGSGKSTLARALVGVWPLQVGGIALDGHALSQWAPAALGRHIGYLPQDARLIEGTIADNISRFDRRACTAAIVAAARAAGVHALIERLPDGYLTDVGEGGTVLPAGQRQRIGLARALYGDPFLVVLDEPNAHLDSTGDRALAEAIATVRRRGGITIVITHRRAVLDAVDTVLVLAGGRIAALGPRDAVLAEVLAPSRAAAAE
jgi:ATP-binding cassette subfamily C protein